MIFKSIGSPDMHDGTICDLVISVPTAIAEYLNSLKVSEYSHDFTAVYEVCGFNAGDSHFLFRYKHFEFLKLLV